MADTEPSIWTHEEVTAVEIPEYLADRIEARVPKTDFESIGEYITFVMEEVLASVEAAETEDFEAVDEAEVERRLKSLGYLDE